MLRRLILPAAALLLPLGPSTRAEELQRADTEKLVPLLREAQTLSTQKQHAEANAALAKVLEALPAPLKGPFNPIRSRTLYNMAANHAQLGQRQQAIDALSRSVENALWNHQFLKVDPAFASLREEKAYQAVVEKASRTVADVAFGLKDMDGKLLEKKDYEGKVLILDLWGTWCPPCRAEIPHFVKLQEKHRAEGLRIVGLTWEKRVPDDTVRARVKDFAEREGINYPLVLAEKPLIDAIVDLQGYPTTFFIGRDGLVAERVVGLLPEAVLEQKITYLLSQKAPDPAAEPVATPAGEKKPDGAEPKSP